MVIIEILGYGEDALTLWALQTDFNQILSKLNDYTVQSDCLVFFRPSFGRSGGDSSPQFGEFDFIILSKKGVYLGESKWDKSSEVRNGIIHLRKNQTIRHEMLRFYIEQWFENKFESWSSFIEIAGKRLKNEGNNKPLVVENTLLQQNIQYLLETIEGYYNYQKPLIKNVLLYFHNGQQQANICCDNDNFDLVILDYSMEVKGNFIPMKI